MDYSSGSEMGYLPNIDQLYRTDVNPFTFALPAGGENLESGLEPIESIGSGSSKDDHVDTRSKDATMFPAGTVVKGKIDSATDQDWFKVSIFKKGVHTFVSSGSGDVRGELFGVKGMTPIKIDDNGSGDGKNFKMDVDLEPGTYYFRVTGPKSPGTEYEISALPPKIDPKDDHVDTRSKDAWQLTVGTASEGKIDYAADQDWFKIFVRKKEVVTFVSSGDGDLKGELFGVKGMNPIKVDDNGAGDGKNFKMEAELDPGYYYFRITGRKSPGAKYTFSTYPPKPATQGLV